MMQKAIIFNFRKNDLDPSKGKQIEFNSAKVEDFFSFSSPEVNLTLRYVQEDSTLNGTIVKTYLKFSPERRDYKIYQNADSSPDLKDFFRNSLGLNENNINDYFALKKVDENNYDFFYFPRTTTIDVVYKALKLDKSQVICDIENNSKNDSSVTIVNHTFEEHRQLIFFGAPGTGKSHEIKKQTADQSVVRTTFHPDSDYSSFVGAYKPTTIDVPLRDVSGHVVVENGNPVIESKIVYEFVEQAFLKAYVNAWTLLAENKPQFLIVEEINRGNCAQIFGDLFQLLDRNDFGFSDYPITADKDLQKHLKKAFENLNISGTDIEGEYEESNDSIAAKVKSGEVLLLPKNLYIWATMNTSDQSLFPIDSAFKRRWDWKYIPISKGFDENGQEIKLAIEGCIKKYSWWSFLEKINVQVGDATQSEDKKLGFFFCKGSAGTISADKFVSKVIFYLWNDVFKNNGFEGDLFKDVDGTVLSFDKFYTSDANGKVSVRKDKVELFLKNLGVEEFGCVTPGDDYLPEVDEDGNNANNSAKDYSRYTINGNGSYSKGSVVLEAVKQYIANNPNKSAEDIVHDWLALEVNVPNFVETQTTFNERRQRSRDSRIDQKAKTTSLANGETIYVSNQYNLERISDVIMKVNGTNWGITISKI